MGIRNGMKNREEKRQTNPRTTGRNGRITTRRIEEISRTTIQNPTEKADDRCDRDYRDNLDNDKTMADWGKTTDHKPG